jgi:single-stranded-DNA-specific exonuclease
MTALESCRDLMERCGGHQQAAGFDLPHENLTAFESRMSRIAAEAITPESLEDTLLIDAAIPASEISLSLCHEIGQMEPFGHGNPSPLFVSSLEVCDSKRIGKTGTHLKLTVRGGGLPPTEAVYWKRGDLEPEFQRGDAVEFCYRLGIHRFRNQESVQLDIADARPANAAN